MKIKRTVSRLTSFLMVVLLAVTWGFAPARAQSIDLSPPEIQHTPDNSQLTGPKQRFVATVTDDNQVSAVYLYYKTPGATEFEPVQMSATADDGQYEITVETEEDAQGEIQYYFLAIDSAENQVFEDYLNPFARTIGSAESITSAEEVAPVEQEPIAVGGDSGISTETSPRVEDEKGGSNLLLYGLGALALIAVVGLAGGSDDDDDEPTGVPDPGQITFTVADPR